MTISLRKLGAEEAKQHFPQPEPSFDFAALAAQLEPGEVYELAVPEGHGVRSFFLRLTKATLHRGLRLRLASGLWSSTRPQERKLIFRAEATAARESAE